MDCDAGIDDAVAMILAMLDPRLEVVALTPTAGAVDATRTTRNAITVVEQLDPPRHPRIGTACDPLDAPVADAAVLHGKEGLGNWNTIPGSRSHEIASDKLMADEIRANAGRISILCMGPLTNVATMLHRDPKLASSIDRIIIVGGAIDCGGDVTASAEFNLHFDPVAADEVFRSATTKTLVPLDVTNQLSFGLDFLDLLPSKHSRVGRLLHEMLPFYYRSMRQNYAREAITLQAVVGWLMLTEPQLFTMQDEHVEVETTGRLTRGALVTDRRTHSGQHSNMEVAMQLDLEAAMVAVRRSLKYVEQHTED